MKLLTPDTTLCITRHARTQSPLLHNHRVRELLFSSFPSEASRWLLQYIQKLYQALLHIDRKCQVCMHSGMHLPPIWTDLFSLSCTKKRNTRRRDSEDPHASISNAPFLTVRALPGICLAARSSVLPPSGRVSLFHRATTCYRSHLHDEVGCKRNEETHSRGAGRRGSDSARERVNSTFFLRKHKGCCTGIFARTV